MNEKNTAEKTKTQYIHMGMFDLAKGFCILDIFLEHWLCTTGFLNNTMDLLARNAIHNMVIPLFFIVSGYGFTHRKKTTALWKQILAMLRVYFFVGVLVTIGNVLLGFFYLRSPLEFAVRAAQMIMSYGLGISYDLVIGGHYFAIGIGAVWFLLADVLCMIFMEYVVCRMQTGGQILTVAAVAAAGCLIGSFVNLPFCLVQAMIGLLSFYFGWQLKQTGYFAEISWKKALILLGCIALWAIGSMNGIYEPAVSAWHNGPLTILCACAAAFAFCQLTVLVSIYHNPVFDAIQWLGRNTLYLIALDTVLVHSAEWQKLKMPAWVFFSFSICFVVVGYRFIMLAGKTPAYLKFKDWTEKLIKCRVG